MIFLTDIQRTLNRHKVALAAGLLVSVLFFGGGAYVLASVSITSATINGNSSEATVAPGESVIIEVSANKSPSSGCHNNWGSTRVTVTGDSYDETYESSLGSYLGASDSDSVVFTAPTTNGDYDVLVELIRGVENGLSCPNEDSAWTDKSFTLHVETPKGCTDPAAENYDDQAVEDDGSCTYEAPAISIDALGDLACGIQDINISGSVTFQDPTEHDAFVIKLDGTIIVASNDEDDAGPDGIPHSWSSVLSSVDIGSHTLEVFIYDDDEDDNYTNKKTSDSIDFSIDPCPPFIEVLSISPEDVVKAPGEDVTYIAEIELGGDPVPHLQCVIFDIFRGDGWNTVSVDINTAGIHTVNLFYDLDGYELRTYDVIVIASEDTCTDATDDNFDTAEFDEEGLYAKTTLTIEEQIEEPDTYIIDGYKWNDEDGDGQWGEESALAGWVIQLLNDQDEVVATTTTDEVGYYSFEVEAGSWKVQEVQQDGWTQKAPEAGYCTFTFSEQQEFVQVALLDTESSADGVCDFGNQQNDEEPEEEPVTPQSGGGGGSGPRISLSDGNDDEPEGQVLGASTTQCGMYLLDYMRQNLTNDTFEVLKLQFFLIRHGYYIVSPTGIFDTATDAGVRAFQETYSSEILKPWVDVGVMSDEHPTGYVFKTTRWKINNMVCPESEAFPILP